MSHIEHLAVLDAGGATVLVADVFCKLSIELLQSLMGIRVFPRVSIDG